MHLRSYSDQRTIDSIIPVALKSGKCSSIGAEFCAERKQERRISVDLWPGVNFKKPQIGSAKTGLHALASLMLSNSAETMQEIVHTVLLEWAVFVFLSKEILMFWAQ